MLPIVRPVGTLLLAASVLARSPRADAVRRMLWPAHRT
jgi:hypothetical protein